MMLELGNETWKWAVVLFLLAVFLLVANHAYKTFSNPDDQFAPPTDWQQADTFDQDHGKTGPGGGQPLEVPTSVPVAVPGEASPTGLGPVSQSAMASAAAAPVSSVATEADPDWSKIQDPSQK